MAAVCFQKTEVVTYRLWVEIPIPWSKFDMPITLDSRLLKCDTWPNQKPEVDLRRYGRHLVKSA